MTVEEAKALLEKTDLNSDVIHRALGLKVLKDLLGDKYNPDDFQPYYAKSVVFLSEDSWGYRFVVDPEDEDYTYAFEYYVRKDTGAISCSSIPLDEKDLKPLKEQAAPQPNTPLTRGQWSQVVTQSRDRVHAGAFVEDPAAGAVYRSKAGRLYRIPPCETAENITALIEECEAQGRDIFAARYNGFALSDGVEANAPAFDCRKTPPADCSFRRFRDASQGPAPCDGGGEEA